ALPVYFHQFPDKFRIFRNIEHISCSVYKNLHSIGGKRRMQLMIYHIRITVFRITDIQIQIHFLLCIFDYTEIDSCLTGFLIPETDSQRSEEHTSELQSRFDLVCRLLLEKKKNTM